MISGATRKALWGADIGATQGCTATCGTIPGCFIEGGPQGSRPWGPRPKGLAPYGRPVVIVFVAHSCLESGPVRDQTSAFRVLVVDGPIATDGFDGVTTMLVVIIVGDHHAGSVGKTEDN